MNPFRGWGDPALNQTVLFVLIAVLVLCWDPGEAWNRAVPPLALLPSTARTASAQRLGVLAIDAWAQSLRDGALNAATDFPIRSTDKPWWQSRGARPTLWLMHGTHFTPADYLAKVREFQSYYPGPLDVLFYYGGIRRSRESQGLNFNSWSADDLRQLRALGGRPFIGLETTDPGAITAMVRQLTSGGYGRRDPLLIRITSEPSTMAYGSTDGTPKGRRHCVAAYRAYHKRFHQAAEQLRAQGREYGISLRIVFAGDNAEDFKHFAPEADDFDVIGMDLFLTPANRLDKLALLNLMSQRWPYKPLSLPEFGVATAGCSSEMGYREVHATPAWAHAALGEVFARLGRHPAGMEQITVFSVDVAMRLPSRRWSWAWTPEMLEMLAEWQAAGRHWRREGFHRYDLRSYLMGKDVLYAHSPDLKLSYRRLRQHTPSGEPLFQETLLYRDSGQWVPVQRVVTADRLEWRNQSNELE